ncbi:unnamed protein product, partial [Didymodactylos carnosus]
KTTPRCLQAALIYCLSANEPLKENVKIGRNLLDKDAKNLEQEIIALKNDSKKLKEVMNTQKVVLQAAKNDAMLIVIKNEFNKAKTDGVNRLNTLFDELSKDEIDRKVLAAEKVQSFLSNILNRIFPTDRFLISPKLDLTFLTIKVLMGADLIYNSEEEAKTFIKGWNIQVHAISENALVDIRKVVNHNCQMLCNKLNVDLKLTTEEVLIEAQKRLTNTFDLVIRPPRLFDSEINEMEDNNEISVIERTYRSWWTLRLIDIPFTEGETDSDTRFRITLASLRSHCLQTLQNNIDAIQEHLETYIQNVLQKAFDRHFQKLDEYLKRYQGFVEQSLNRTFRTKEEKENFKIQLNELLNNFHQNFKDIKMKLQLLH